jgi:hypothetical protein
MVIVWQGWVAMKWLQTWWASGGFKGVRQMTSQSAGLMSF